MLLFTPKKAFLVFIFVGLLVFIGLLLSKNSDKEPIVQSPPSLTVEPITSSATQPVQTGNTKKLKTYINTEFGFEFQHPDWSFEINGFYSPFSKFNLQGDSSEENYNPLRPIFLLNIVTHDFADRAVISRQNLGAIESGVTIGGIQGKKYEYVFEGVPKISIDLPLGEFRMILGTEKKYKDVFNQILVSFKFLK
ncbi:MAG: hypothetical protein AAB536_03680 [Patescibacteria group bacterium]